MADKQRVPPLCFGWFWPVLAEKQQSPKHTKPQLKLPNSTLLYFRGDDAGFRRLGASWTQGDDKDSVVSATDSEESEEENEKWNCKANRGLRFDNDSIIIHFEIISNLWLKCSEITVFDCPWLYSIYEHQNTKIRKVGGWWYVPPSSEMFQRMMLTRGQLNVLPL